MTKDPIREEDSVVIVDESDFVKTHARYRAVRERKRREAADAEDSVPNRRTSVPSGTRP